MPSRSLDKRAALPFARPRLLVDQRQRRRGLPSPQQLLKELLGVGGTASADAAEGINCDLSAVASGSSTDGFAMYSMTQSHFDKDSNGRVTKSEFTSAMLGFTCCGK